MMTLSASLLRRAAALAGLGLLAAAAPAKIVVVDNVNLVIPTGGQGTGYYVDLAKGLFSQDPNASFVTNGDANIEFFRQSGPITSLGMALNDGRVNALQASEAWESSTVAGPVSLDPGTLVGPNPPYAFSRRTGSTNYSPWRQERTGYLGIQFVNSNTEQLDYGWVEIVTTTTSTPAYTATITRWGFDDTGASILTAQTQPVPEPATFAALGLGALAFVKRRRRA